MTYYVTNENAQETTKFTNKRNAHKFMRALHKSGIHANFYIYDGDRRVS